MRNVKLLREILSPMRLRVVSPSRCVQRRGDGQAPGDSKDVVRPTRGTAAARPVRASLGTGPLGHAALGASPVDPPPGERPQGLGATLSRHVRARSRRPYGEIGCKEKREQARLASLRQPERFAFPSCEVSPRPIPVGNDIGRLEYLVAHSVD